MRLMLMVFTVLLTACASTPKGPLTLQQQIEHSSTITLELIDSESGLLFVKAGLPDGSIGTFLIDSGATISAIYPDVQNQLNLQSLDRTVARVHGMIASQLKPLTEISGLTLGQTELPPFRAAILPRQKGNQKDTRFRRPEHEGIIGMNVLSDFHLYVDAPNKVISFIPTALGPPSLPTSWDIVELTRNPFLENGLELHFFQLRLGNALTPALLDTGSQFNMMNWNSRRFPRLRSVKRHLREKWEVEGAIGTFRPVTKIISKNARAGQKFWGDNEFLVLDFENLDLLGIDGRPFVIGGMALLSDEEVFIDFKDDKLYFAPSDRSYPSEHYISLY